MKQINLNNIDWLRLFTYLSIIILTILLFNQCDKNKKLTLQLDVLGKDAIIAEQKIEKYVKANNELNEKLSKLSNEKQKIKEVYIDRIKKIYVEKKKVDSFNTTDFSEFYSKRYDCDVLASSKGVILDDITASKNVKELYDKDIAELELVSTKKQLILEESKGLIRDTIIFNLSTISREKDKQLEYKNEEIKNIEKSLKKEKVKNGFWKLATIGVLSGATYLLIAN